MQRAAERITSNLSIKFTSTGRGRGGIRSWGKGRVNKVTASAFVVLRNFRNNLTVWRAAIEKKEKKLFAFKWQAIKPAQQFTINNNNNKGYNNGNNNGNNAAHKCPEPMSTVVRRKTCTVATLIATPVAGCKLQVAS